MKKLHQTHFSHIKNLFDKNVEKNLENYYIAVATKYITNEMIEAFAKNDKRRLISLTKDSYNQLRLEDSYLEQFTFHKPDGKTFLRVHKVELYDDNISQISNMAKDIHTKQTVISGFEVAFNTFTYKVFIPLFYKDNYIGGFELGISPKKIVDVVTFFSKIDALIQIHSNTLFCENNSIFYAKIADNKILTHIPDICSVPKQIPFTYEDKEISLFSFDINDYNDKPIGKFLFFQDFTQDQDIYSNLVQNIFLIFIISVFIAFLVINFGFNRLIVKLESSYEELQKYAELIDETVITSSTDLDGNILSVSQAFSDVSGYCKKELIGKTHRIIKNPDTNPAIYRDLWFTITNNQIWRGEIKNTTKDGDPYWVHATISPVFDKTGKKIGYTAIRQNITNKKKIEELSITDGLTQIFNKKHFHEIFPKIINSAKRKNTLVCMMKLDIDFFKQYNEHYGDHMGDILLIKIAKCLKDSSKRADDLTFRLDGGEFAIIFTVEDRVKAFEFATIIQTHINELNIKHEYSNVSENITVSIGLVCKRAIELYDKEMICKEANSALNEAKKSGKNKIFISKND
jgi:diguanylate cyclase (GGDEF)-like protein/PAS domain S-box-containing protein